MENQIQLSLPESWFDVTINQYQELATYTEASLTNTINVISCLTDEDPEIIKTLPIDDLKLILSNLAWSSDVPPAEYKHTINIDGIDYSMVPKLNELSLGEWVDMEEYISDIIPNMHFIMSILYRPLISAVNDKVRIVEKYDANKMLLRAELFKEKMSIGDVYGAAIFFFLLGTKFIQNLPAYLEEEMK
jgi:hypothetical protein